VSQWAWWTFALFGSTVLGIIAAMVLFHLGRTMAWMNSPIKNLVDISTYLGTAGLFIKIGSYLKLFAPLLPRNFLTEMVMQAASLSSILSPMGGKTDISYDTFLGESSPASSLVALISACLVNARYCEDEVAKGPSCGYQSHAPR